MKIRSTIALIATAALSMTSAFASPFETPGQPDTALEENFEAPQGPGGGVPPEFGGGFSDFANAPSENESQYNDTTGNADAGVSRDY